MGFTLKIEGNESLFYGENIVQMVTASLDTPKEGGTISIIMPAEDVNITSKIPKSHSFNNTSCVIWFFG